MNLILVVMYSKLTANVVAVAKAFVELFKLLY